MVGEDFLKYVTRSREVLDEAVRKALQDVLGRTGTGNNPILLAALADGKKIRGCLTCVVGEALGAEREALVPRAVAVELIQTATLIHDDFVDQDTTRRNRPAVWTLVGGRRAVLVGDVIFASAIGMMSEMSREDGLAVARAIAMIATGALNEPLTPNDLEFFLQNVGGSEKRLYRKIIRLKTGILFGTACELGAIAADAPMEAREAAYQYGLRTGEAYQIADDLEDLRACELDVTVIPKKIASLAPALLCFADRDRPLVVEILRKREKASDDGLGEVLPIVREPMEREIARLLRLAVSHMKGYLPSNGAGVLAREAPAATIRLFNQGWPAFAP